jgi:hypothetical protein
MKNRFKYFLNERVEIGLAKKAFVTLSSEAKNAIDEWERAGWETGRLVQSLNKKDSIAEEIYQAFMPIREFMKKKYGSKITLYRGIILDNTSYDKNKKYESWTSDEKIAEVFAGFRRFDVSKGHPSVFLNPITDNEIKKALRSFEKLGFTTFRNNKYVLNKKNPEFYDIFDTNRQFITDGDTENLENKFKLKQKDIEIFNKERKTNGKVFKKTFDIDSIVWISNSLDSKEFIVKVR